MNKWKKFEDIATGIFAVGMTFWTFSVLISVFLPRLYELYGEGAKLQIIKFLLLLAFIIGMIFVARWQMEEVNPKIKRAANEYDYWDAEWIKGLKSIIGNKDSAWGGLLRVAFHAIPLYFPLLVGKMDLLVEFKVVLFAFAMLAYLLVELRYVFNSIVRLGNFILKKLHIRHWLVKLLFALLGVIVFAPAALYVGYRLVIFYINYFSK